MGDDSDGRHHPRQLDLIRLCRAIPYCSAIRYQVVSALIIRYIQYEVRYVNSTKLRVLQPPPATGRLPRLRKLTRAAPRGS